VDGPAATVADFIAELGYNPTRVRIYTDPDGDFAMGDATQPKSGSKLKTFLKVVVLTVALLAIAFVGIGQFVLDGKYDIARETTINAKPEAVHAQVGDLREWPNWLPFTKHDKTYKTEIEQATGVGAHQHWSNGRSSGELTFTKSDPEKGIEYDMLFDGKIPSKGSLLYTPAGDATKVTWRMWGQNDGLMGHWMGWLMPKIMPALFDEGLADLKAKVETK
jgi:hypothetical protein